MQSIYESHREHLSQFLNVGDLAILFSGKAPKSTADAHYAFLPNKNFFYFTGCTEEHFIVTLLMTEKGLETTLFIEKPDYDVEKWVGRKLTKESAIEKSGIKEVQYLENFIPFTGRLINNGKVERLFLDLEKLSWDEKIGRASCRERV